MKYQYLTNMELEAAKEGYLNALKENGMIRKTETVPIQQALGRVTSRAIYAELSVPHYNAAAMDGIAVLASDTFGASETTPKTLLPQQYIQVDTGDPLPKGCDAVVMIEDVIFADQGSVLLYQPASPWQHVRQIGEDICQGDMLLPAFYEITPAAMGSILAGGIGEVEVIRRPVVGIIPTGDEIIPPCNDPKEGDIMEFNSTIFSGLLRQWGADPKTYPIVKDKLEQIEQALETALSECDAVILNAGSSAGREDFSSTAISHVGQVFAHGIAIKPGKPSILGWAGQKPVFGIPGYPVSGIIVMNQLVRPVIDLLCGRLAKEGEEIDVVLSKKLTSSLKYQEFLRVSIGYVNGKFVAVPLNRGAGVVTSFVKADGIVTIPQNVEGYDAGAVVCAQLLRPKEEIMQTLCVIGSHDPLIDEVANFLRQQDPMVLISSSHVGSMGGIMAVKRGEAHMGAIHLLDEQTGEYNFSYLEKYFPQGGVVLVECVNRTQGFMVKKGNPHQIHSFSDIAEKNLSYVNRQKGSGTRILCDYLLKQQGVSAEKIYGYSREEFTHTGVAAQIAGNSADVGLGVYSAAKMYGLDFVPLCDEKYDLLISKEAFQLPQTQKFLEVLQSSAFQNRILEMGGYTFAHPGTIKKEY